MWPIEDLAICECGKTMLWMDFICDFCIEKELNEYFEEKFGEQND